MTETLESIFGIVNAIIKSSRHNIISGDFLIPKDYFEELLRLQWKVAKTIEKENKKT